MMQQAQPKARRRGQMPQHGPFDVILELVGASNLPENLLALATGGRVAVIGVGAGEKGELDLRALCEPVRASTVPGCAHARPPEVKALGARMVEHEVLPLFNAGAVKVLVVAQRMTKPHGKTAATVTPGHRHRRGRSKSAHRPHNAPCRL
jgi:NADPH:quinone reductase-like Zn-dependent oxidoreductase